MKVKDFKKVDMGSLKGFLTIVTSEGFEMKGFKLIEGQNGLFIGAPSQKGTDEKGDDKWYDQVWVPKELNEELLNLVSQELDGDDLTSENPQVPF